MNGRYTASFTELTKGGCLAANSNTFAVFRRVLATWEEVEMLWEHEAPSAGVFPILFEFSQVHVWVFP